MQEPETSQNILVGITTYAGDFEQNLILRKTVQHLRAKNGKHVFLLVISDGVITDPWVLQIADAVLDRPGPCGLHQGELDSIWQLVRFAQKNGFTHLIKSAGDIIMTQSNWAEAVMLEFKTRDTKIMSTHWFKDNSWIVGTKFFVAKTDFLAQTLPNQLESANLEEAFTAGIEKQYVLKDVAHLINSNTGERHEVAKQLRDWGWEHAHRLSKFVEIDESQSYLTRMANKYIFYQLLRFWRDMKRTLGLMR